MNRPDLSDEARKLLPWYVNRTLTASEQTMIEKQLESDPALRAELRWLESLRESSQTGEPDHSPEEGLAILTGRMAAERKGMVVPLLPNRRPKAAANQSWLAIAASVVVVFQAGVIGFLLSSGDQEKNLQPLSGLVRPAGVILLQITFRESATELAIRKALTSVGAEIVGGPGALGVYQVVPGIDIDESIRMLKQDPAVESVTRPAQ